VVGTRGPCGPRRRSIATKSRIIGAAVGSIIAAIITHHMTSISSV